MNIRRWRMLALLLSLSALLVVFTPATLAYVADESNLLVNTFTAPAYVPPQPAQVQVNVLKIVTSTGNETISPEGFRFALLDTQTGQSRTLTANANGEATTSLTIDEIGRTYTYRLTEIDDGRINVTYSQEVYDITISPAVDADNCIVPHIAVNGAPMACIAVTFENVYDPGMDIPNTGDSGHVLLNALLLILSGAGMVVCRAYHRRMQ